MNAQEIAAKLTKAQREALLKMPAPKTYATDCGDFISRQWFQASDIGTSGALLNSLEGFGGVDPQTHLLGPILVTHEYESDGKWWAITDDGLAVRQIIQEQTK